MRVLVGFVALSLAAGCARSAEPPSLAPRCPDQLAPSSAVPDAAAPDVARMSVPSALTVVLQGPVHDPKVALAGRVVALPEDCGPPSPDFPRGELRATIQQTLDGPLLEARSFRYPGDLACAPIEYCALAFRTVTGWWLTPHTDGTWCSGITGPSSRVSVEDEVFEAQEGEPGVIIYRAVNRTMTRDYGTAKSRNERWLASEAPVARMCEAVADGRVWCQRNR